MKKDKENINKILEILEENYKDFGCGLNYNTPFELLIATILSAQCTDERVNIVTKELFSKANTPKAILALGEDALLFYIKSCGLSKTKCKNILKTCEILANNYNSEVPKKMEELILLPGVGRKTANVLLSNAFNVPSIAVDTHVFRVSNRLGLAVSDNVRKTEDMLMENIPREKWSNAHHWLIWHGRKLCMARNPKCSECFLSSYCKFNKK